MFDRDGFDISIIQRAVPPTAWISNRADNVGATVRLPNRKKGRILIRDTWNTDIVDELTQEPGDLVLYKHRFSGFFETDLDAQLKRMGARYIIFTCCTTSICLESTIRDAMFREYSPVLLADCTGEVLGCDLPRTNHDATLLLIEKQLGWVSSSDEFVKVLQVTATPTSPD